MSRIEQETHKTWRDWLMVLAIAVVLVAAFLAPAYVVNQQREETARVLQQVTDHDEVTRRVELAIQVNTYTITCLLALPPDNRTESARQDCLEAGIEWGKQTLP